MNREKISHWTNTSEKYRKGSIFLVAKTIKCITNHSLVLAKTFSQQPVLFKTNASLYFNASQCSGAIKACKKLAFPIKLGSH